MPRCNIADPPVSSLEADLQDWKASVGNWVDLMKAR